MKKWTKIDSRHYKVGRDVKVRRDVKGKYARKAESQIRAYLGLVFLLILGGLYTQRIFHVDLQFDAVAPTTEKAYALILPTATPTPKLTFKEARKQKVYDFLVSKNSPLAPYANLIVDEADKNDISWTLVVAISGKESSFGKNIQTDSHNAWGVMAWDKAGNRSIRNFGSWEQSIRFESKLLADNYRENMNRGIQEKYCPSFECSDTWVATVTNYQEEVNN